MASLRDIRTQIRSKKGMQQITKAMKMVSAAKLRKAQDNIMAARPFANQMDEVLTNLASRGDAVRHPLMVQRPIKKVELVILTSDRGLCGGFNSNVIRRAQRFITENEDTQEIALSTIGRKGHDSFRKRKVPLRHDYAGVFNKLNYGLAREISAELASNYAKGEVDAVYLLYNEFITAATQKVSLVQLLPIQPDRTAKATGAAAQVDYLYEPGRDQVLEALLPKYLAIKLFRALLESVASEHGARMSAMENATKNASEMLAKLTLLYNRTRQAAITKEPVESFLVPRR